MRLAISLTALVMVFALVALACTREVVKEVVKEVVVEKPIEVVKTEIREVIVEKPITQIKETVIIATPSPADAMMDERIVPSGTFNGAIGNFSPVTGWGPSCTACSQLVGASVGEALFATARDESGAIGLTPRLVEKWELADDASYSDFKLQKGVQFHQDFGELTADDVAWYFNLINTNTNPESKHDTGVQIFDLAMAEAIDRYTVRFNWGSYGGYTLMMEFTDIQEGVETMSKKAFDTKGQEWMSENVPITTGPFEVQKWTQGEEIRLIAVPDHWRKTSNIARVSILAVPEGTTRRAMLESGQAHGAQIGLKDMPAMINSGFKLAPELIQNQVNLGFGGNYWESVHAKSGEPLERTRDISKPWVGDPYENGDTFDENTHSMQNSRKVRWALSQAIDRDLIAETVLSDLGWGFPVGHMSTDDPLYLNNPGRWDIPYDPEAAQALLEEAGHGGCSDLTPIVWTGPSGVGVEVWDAVGVMWQTNLGCTPEFDRTDYYAQHRPGIVARTSINIYSGCCPGMGIWPMEWSFSSENYPGGFGVGIETPTHSRIYTTKKQTSDPEQGFALFGQAVPTFWAGILLIILFTVYLDWLPAAGMGEGIAVRNYIMPSIVLAWLPAAGYLRFTRSAMLEVLDSEYVKLAKAKGVPYRSIVWKHAFRNASLIPLTATALVLAGFITGSVLVEAVFAWPGIGFYAVQAVATNNINVLVAIVLIFTVLFIIANFIVDIMYGLLDPRIRYS